MSSSSNCSTNNFYEITCPNCKLQTTMHEAKYLSLAGPDLKALVDKGDPNPIMSLKLFSTSSSSASPRNQKIHELACSRCNFPFPISSAVRKVGVGSGGDDPSSTKTTMHGNAFGTSEDREYNDQLSKVMNRMLLGETEEQQLRGPSESVTGNNDAAVLMKDALDEAAQEIVAETDPLMIALERVKMMNPKVDPGDFEVGTARLTYTFRWLVKPIHAFLRVFLFRNLDHYLLGSVSVFKRSRASIGKKEMFSTPSWLSFNVTNWFYAQVLPLALAADAPFSLLVIGVIVGLWGSNMILLHYFLYPASSSLSSPTSVSWIQRMESIVFSFSFITFFFGAASVYFIVRTLAREPGYCLPNTKKNKMLKIEGGVVSSSQVTAKDLVDHLNHEDSWGDDDDDNDDDEQRQGQTAVNHRERKKRSTTTDARATGTSSSSSSSNAAAAAGSKWCDTCHIWRPPKAAHCRLCNLCVTRSEIHCTAIGAHIGERNYLFYCAFVFSTFAACNFQALQQILLLIVVILFSVSGGGNNGGGTGGGGGNHRLSFWGWLFFLIDATFSLMVLFWTGSMWSRQLHNIKTGLTTRERLKAEFSNAGVPKSDASVAAASSICLNKEVDRVWSIITRSVPASNFVLEDQLANSDSAVNERSSVVV